MTIQAASVNAITSLGPQETVGALNGNQASLTQTSEDVQNVSRNRRDIGKELTEAFSNLKKSLVDGFRHALNTLILRNSEAPNTPENDVQSNATFYTSHSEPTELEAKDLNTPENDGNAKEMGALGHSSNEEMIELKDLNPRINDGEEKDTDSSHDDQINSKAQKSSDNRLIDSTWTELRHVGRESRLVPRRDDSDLLFRAPKDPIDEEKFRNFQPKPIGDRKLVDTPRLDAIIDRRDAWRIIGAQREGFNNTIENQIAEKAEAKKAAAEKAEAKKAEDELEARIYNRENWRNIEAQRAGLARAAENQIAEKAEWVELDDVIDDSRDHLDSYKWAELDDVGQKDKKVNVNRDKL